MLDEVPPPLVPDLLLVRAALIDCRIEAPPSALARAMVQLASAVDSYLPRARRELLWKRLATSGCRTAAAARRWLDLHSALATEDAAAIASAAGRLLREKPSPDLVSYLVATEMTGLLLGGNAKGAMKSFEERRQSLGLEEGLWDPVFRVLVSQASAR
jgi:hypothetical protein